MMKSDNIIAAVLVAAVTLAATGCRQGKTWHHASGSTWGTTYSIKYKADKELTDSIVHQMQLINQSLSPFEPHSLISKINDGEEVYADVMLQEVFKLSQQICEESGGMFDPTVAPLINLWGFGYRQGAEDMPTQAQIDSALTSVGIRECSIDSAGHIVKKSPETTFNFSALAKGYGVDRVAAMLQRNGCTDYMVEIGGEIALAGDGPSSDKWKIQIDAPVVEETGITHTRLDVLHTTDICIATSGNYRNHHNTSQGDVGHTISPITGRPIATSTLSATILAPNTALADALATAVMAMDDTVAIAMLQRIGDIEVLIVKGKSDGTYELITTPRFAQALK